MRLRPLDSFGLDVPVPHTTGEIAEGLAAGEPSKTAEGLAAGVISMRFEVPVAAHAGYLVAMAAWARASRFRIAATRDSGTAHLRRWERDGWRVVLHLGVDPTSAALVVRSPDAKLSRYAATSWDATLEESTDLEVAVREACTDFGRGSPTATRAIEHRLGLPPSALEAFDPTRETQPTVAAIVEGMLQDKSRLQLPAGSTEAHVVDVDGARHYTIRSDKRLSATSLGKHYRAWATAHGYEIRSDLYDGEILELTLQRKTRGLVISWARGESHTTVQVGLGRRLFASRADA